MRVNGKEYRIPDLSDFDTAIKLEEKGISLLWIVMDAQEKFKTSPVTTIRDVLACFMMASKEEATTEIKAHIENGGSLIELMNEMLDDINKLAQSGEKSGFSEAEKVPQKQKSKATVKGVPRKAQD